MWKKILLLGLLTYLVTPRVAPCATPMLLKFRNVGAAFSIPMVEQRDIPFIFDVCNSAPPANSTVWFNVDILDTLNEIPVESNVSLHYSFDNQASWDSISMTSIDTIGYKITYQTDIMLPSSGTVYYYIRVQKISNGYYATQSPINLENTLPTPINLMVYTWDEVIGDTTNGAAGPWLDLAGCWVGYSPDSLYIRISNNNSGAGWPWYESYLFGPWYFYAGGVYNPEAISDTFNYSLLRVSNPLMSSNLYKMNKYTNDHWVIGGIARPTIADTMWLRCSFDDLINDPDFGPWPNSSGLYISGMTSTGSLGKQTVLINDYTPPCRFYPETQTFTIGTNTPPVLTNPMVSPGIGGPSTTFTFTVTYTDADNNLPTLKNVIVDGISYQMNSDDHSYSNGAEFTFSKSDFSVGDHYFYYQFCDGLDTVTTSEDTFSVYLCDVATLSIDSPPDTVFVDSIYTPLATVANFDSIQHSFNVNCKIDTSGVLIYEDSCLVENLASRDSIQVPFADWTVGSVPNISYNLTVYTQLPGDENPLNDTISMIIVSIETGVEEKFNTQVLPNAWQLAQNRPNPFVKNTDIRYQIPKKCDVSLKIYNNAGQLIRILVNKKQKPNYYVVRWDGKDEEGRIVGSGIYFLKLEAQNFRALRKIVIIGKRR